MALLQAVARRPHIYRTSRYAGWFFYVRGKQELDVSREKSSRAHATGILRSIYACPLPCFA
jgi:hypothetical protein